MQYISTRNPNLAVSSSKAIVNGISSEGGLYVPLEIPKISAKEVEMLIDMDYSKRAVHVLSKFLTDFTQQELIECVKGAYGDNKFDEESIAPISKLYPNLYFLELWHGPTSAFKDMALQLLPHLLVNSAKKNNVEEKIVILVATSGDTGKAALEGFRDVKNTHVIVFYPQNGVSPMQKLQMQTQEGRNVDVCAIDGNFDDAQTAVKQIFTSEEIKKVLNDNHMTFSSANSINWGRLVPQIVYYVSSYCELLKNKEIEKDEKFNVVVPTGNFGNILAAYYAKHMGIPINMLICASNKNNVLTDFFKTGTYNRNREFMPSISPSMDILISSNLERLLYHLTDNENVIELMQKLKNVGSYTVDNKTKTTMDKEFYAGYCDDLSTKEYVKKVYDKYSYLLDTHTAVAAKVYEDYVEKTGDNSKTIIASTANPYKFSSSVLSAIIGENKSFNDDFDAVKTLREITSIEPPVNLACLKNKEIKHSSIISKDEILNYTKNILGVE